MLKALVLLFSLMFLSACGDGFEAESLAKKINEGLENEAPQPPIGEVPIEEIPVEKIWPKFDWDNQHRDTPIWNEYTYAAIEDHGQMLTTTVPEDIENFCPKYRGLDTIDQKMFWISLVAAMSRFESGFNPDISYKENFTDQNGNFVISRGLLQLSIESARGYSCDLTQAEDLHNPEVNLSCTIRILDRWIGRDKYISNKVSGSWRGGARYWSVLRTPSILASIQKKTSSEYPCKL